MSSETDQEVREILEKLSRLDEVDRIRIRERIDILLEDDKYRIRSETVNGVIYPDMWTE